MIDLGGPFERVPSPIIMKMVDYMPPSTLMAIGSTCHGWRMVVSKSKIYVALMEIKRLDPEINNVIHYFMSTNGHKSIFKWLDSNYLIDQSKWIKLTSIKIKNQLKRDPQLEALAQRGQYNISTQLKCIIRSISGGSTMSFLEWSIVNAAINST